MSIMSELCDLATAVLPHVGAQWRKESGAPPPVSDPR